MEANLTKIGNSLGIRIPAKLIKHYGLEVGVNITPKADGIFITPKKRSLREGWEEVANKLSASKGVVLLDKDLGDWLEVDLDIKD